MKGFAASALFLFLAASGSWAAQSSERVDPDQRAEAWKAALRKIDGQLRNSELAPAREGAIALAQDMAEQMGTGGRGAYSLAVACAFRAIAEAGLSQDRDALWSWRMAQIFFPEIDKTDLRPYGAPAARLKESRFRAQFPGQDLDPPKGSVVQAPVLKKRIEPSYPEKMRKMFVATSLKLDLLIDTKGIPREPKALTPVKEPSFVYAVLEAIRQWEFEPATFNGQPVTAHYELEVTFAPQE